MTFTQLEVFAALARAGSFSRAAALLGITQSAVSHALRALEGELQVQLVRREGPHSPLTDAGTRLLQRANDILQQKEADRKSTRLNSSHTVISYAVFCLKKKKKQTVNKCEV